MASLLIFFSPSGVFVAFTGVKFFVAVVVLFCLFKASPRLNSGTVIGILHAWGSVNCFPL